MHPLSSSSSLRDMNPKATTRSTRSFPHCQSFSGTTTDSWKDSPPEYTSLKDIIPELSTSPPCFWKRIPLPAKLRRQQQPRPCRCSNVDVLKVRKRRLKKVMPADDDDESPLWSYPPPPAPLYPQRLCMQISHPRQNCSEKCFACVIWDKMFQEVKHVFTKITDGIGKLFTSMRVQKHGHGH